MLRGGKVHKGFVGEGVKGLVWKEVKRLGRNRKVLGREDIERKGKIKS